MPTDKLLKPVRWEYDILQREFIPRQEPRPVPPTGIFDSPTYCFEINALWMPHLLGAMELLLQKDSWSGGDDEIFRAQQAIYTLLASVTVCGESMRMIEQRSIALDERCDQTQWKYTDEPDSAWRNLGTPVCDGLDGEPGAPGQDGEPGEPGRPGQDCDCGDPVPTQPTVPVGDDRCEQACNIAMGLGEWLYGRYDDTLAFTKAAFDAGVIVADAVSDFIDAFPVLGAIVNAVVDYISGLGQVDIAALQGANNNEFKEWIQCELYRIMADDTGDFTLEYFDQVKDELQAWGLALPPQGPLLTLIGQAFAAFLETVPASEMLRRANVYKDNTANCDLCDVTCEDCVNQQIITIRCNNENSYLLPQDWAVCNSTVTSYDRSQITVALPMLKIIKRIKVAWRSAFDPNVTIGNGIITVNNLSDTKDITGIGNSTSPQEWNNVGLQASQFTIETTGTVNDNKPLGYCAFFYIEVEVCDAPIQP